MLISCCRTSGLPSSFCAISINKQKCSSLLMLLPRKRVTSKQINQSSRSNRSFTASLKRTRRLPVLVEGLSSSLFQKTSCFSTETTTSTHHHVSPSRPKFIKVVEVGPRDGLQNEPNIVSAQTKIDLIHKLYDAGCQHIEATSFVSPQWVPQMADAGHVMEGIRHLGSSISDKCGTHKHVHNFGGGITLSCLTPNVIGVRRALLAGANEVVVFASASETFSQQNLNCSIDESLERFHDLIEEAKSHTIPIRGYVSCAWGCPYEGQVSFDNVQRVSTKLMEMGCYEISLCDTIGCATPNNVIDLLQKLQSAIDKKHLAVHFHDTYGQALVNTYVAISQGGITTVDSSIGGLGNGCPFAIPNHHKNYDKRCASRNGATTMGNLATEDLVYMLHGMGIQTGLNLQKLCDASQFIFDKLGQTTRSKVGRAIMLEKEENTCGPLI